MESRVDAYANYNEVDDEDFEELKPFDFNNLPEHACNYCGIHSVDEVVKCTFRGCNKWFCNGKTRGLNGSHAIIHMVKGRHKEFVLHPESEHGDTILECYVCGNKNCFLLGFVPIKNSEDSQVIIICRGNCLNMREFNDLLWEMDEFTPLIEEKMIVSWMVKVPEEQDLQRARYVTMDQIVSLEELRIREPNAQLDDISKKRYKDRLSDVKCFYVNGEDYVKTFIPLIDKEAEYDRLLKESQTQNDVNIRWEISLKHKNLAYFVFSSKEDFDTNLLPGNEMKLSLKEDNQVVWSSQGSVVKITAAEEICLELYRHELPPNKNGGFTIEFVWKPTSYNRMKVGLQNFLQNENSISSYLYYTILGHEIEATWNSDLDLPTQYNAPGLPELNKYQIEAVKQALNNPLSLIQGPPGTGKTITSASIVYHLINQMKKKKISKQILVAAPSNIVADQLAENIHLTGAKVVRVTAKARESVSSSIEYLTLHNQTRSLKLPKYEKLQKLFALLEDQGELSHSDEAEFKSLKNKAEVEILEAADVVVCTCVTAADHRLQSYKFPYVLIDEATQAVEPECILPMLHSAKQIILVGDHRQLGPVITCREASRAGFNKSMFERFVSMGIRPIRLQVQYRMHPELSIFPSNTFYEGSLQNGVQSTDRRTFEEFPWPRKNKPMFFLNTYGAEELSASGTSYINRNEATQIERLLYYMIKAGIKAKQIGIITPYKGQRAFVSNYLQKNGQLNPSQYKEIEITSVDGYQGREKDYILITCVRSNDNLGIGFLNDPRRLNVSITRARYGLIIVGNAKVLARVKSISNKG